MKTTNEKAPKPVPLTQQEIDQIRRSIREIGDMGRRLKSSGLNQRAILVLLHDATGGIPLSTIKKVLDGIAELPNSYLTSP